MDPNQATRAEFTEQICRPQLPPDAPDPAPVWKVFVSNQRELVTALAAHPAMAPNLQQTYMTPAASKNKVYFMWDFVGRTLGLLYQVSPTLNFKSNDEKEMWADIQGRTTMAAVLISDKVPGMLDRMVEQLYSDQAGQHPELGEDILKITETIDMVVGEEMMALIVRGNPGPEALATRIQMIWKMVGEHQAQNPDKWAAK